MPTENDKPEVIRASFLNEIVAKNVIQIRQHRQLTQLELAQRAGMSRFTVAVIESGRRIVAINDLPSLCLALQCSLHDLTEGGFDEPADRHGTPLGYARSVMLPKVRREPIEDALRRLIRDELLRP